MSDRAATKLLSGGEGVAFDALQAYAQAMESKPPPPPVPVIALNSPLLAANVVAIGYFAGNGGIMMQLGDQRAIPVEPGQPQREAVYEIGRFALTPRALRQLLDSAQAAAKDYESNVGKPLPTMDQFNAAAAMAGLFQPQPPPPDPRPE